MAKKTPPKEPEAPAELLISRDEARAKIEDRILKGRHIRETEITNASALADAKNEFDKWDSFNNELLRRIFSTGQYANEYSASPGFAVISMYERQLGQKIAEHHEDIEEKLHRLGSILERLELIQVNNVTAQIGRRFESNAPRRTNKVFVVHGHEEASKTNLEVFLHEVGLEPIVLHREADEGLTVIEKFEKHSDVGYAFILLTPDEVAYPKSDEDKDDENRRKEVRARPNVIFEFGYFVGKLGRPRVCCLYTGDVALPSDVNGMIYKRFNNSNIEEIAYSIIKDLKASGYSVG